MAFPALQLACRISDITIAQALKPLGYTTGQFGKNHLGDRRRISADQARLRRVLGNLYHLNAEEEPERPYYPKNDTDFVKPNSPRGVLKASADGKIEDTGPLNRKRVGTIDDETTAAAIDFMTRQVRANRPFFTWMNTTRMHAFTHVRESMRGQSGMPGNEYADGMIEHDGDVGKLLKAVDDLGVANNTIVVYTTDNGPNQWSWPDAATTQFRREKEYKLGRCFPRAGDDPLAGPDQGRRNLERHRFGPRLVPHAARGCGRHEYKERLLNDANFGGKTFKVHLDGYNQLPYLTGQQPKSARNDFSVFQRRWECGRVSLQRLEGRVLRAA